MVTTNIINNNNNNRGKRKQSLNLVLSGVLAVTAGYLLWTTDQANGKPALGGTPDAIPAVGLVPRADNHTTTHASPGAPLVVETKLAVVDENEARTTADDVRDLLRHSRGNRVRGFQACLAAQRGDGDDNHSEFTMYNVYRRGRKRGPGLQRCPYHLE
jgi:hypothetical protein